jgi:hypothetical protein
MRCLYCGRQLALFRKLTGGGDFCSDAHRQSYQDEYNRLALSRLLQTQTPGEEAPAGNLPPPRQKLQRRAGSLLDLHDVPAPVYRDERSAHGAAPAIEQGSGLDSKRRAGFIPDRLRGTAGAVTTHADLSPTISVAELTIAPTPAIAEERRIRCRGERVPMRPPAVRPGAACVHSTAVEFDAGGGCLTVPTSEIASLSTGMTKLAGKALLAEREPRGERPSPRRPVLARIIADRTVVPPVPAVATEPRHLGIAAPLTVAPSVQLFDAELAQFDEPAASRPCFDFVDTVSPGRVAGMKLGIEQIRFEFAGAPAQEAAEAAPVQEAPPEDQMLPHQFIAAVQRTDEAAEPGANVDPEGTSTEEAPAIDVTCEPELEPEAAVDVAGRRMCAWLPVDLKAAPASTRQRLMQTFQAVGIAALLPSAPEFGMLPMRPKYVLGRVPAPASGPAVMEKPVGISPGAVAVTDRPAQPGAAVAEIDAEMPPRLQEFPIDGALEFLQDYEKRQQSVFSKLLGRIGQRR